MPAPLEIKVIPVHPDTWTPVVVPFDCSSIAVKNTSVQHDLCLRTDAADATTEDLVGACREQSFAVPFHRYRFLAGSQPLWLRSTGEVGTAVVKFLA